MKKILIINNNLDMGGIQKSLINLLKEVHQDYDITLLLFSKSGALLAEVPNDVKIITPRKCYRMLGLTSNELKKYPLLFITKAFLIQYAKLFSRCSAVKLLGLFQKKVKGYDVVISYSHLTHHKYFGNGCGDFVLHKTDCCTKICLIHCDYLNSGYNTQKNNAEYSNFNKIACCSNSVKEKFIQGTSIEESRIYTLRNFFDLNIIELANNDSYHYDKAYVNLLTVARLSSEKGIDRAIEALFLAKRRDIRYYVIGNGPKKSELINMVKKYNMENQVFFMGEQKNPYGYMKNADYLLVPSVHEAAPIVFDEAKILNLQIISTNTTSASEMISHNDGIVCDNSIEGIKEVIVNLKKNESKNNGEVNNRIQINQFDLLVN